MTIDPGEGFRLLAAGEVIKEGDEQTYSETGAWWTPVTLAKGSTYRTAQGRGICDMPHVPMRRTLASEADLVPANELKPGDEIWLDEWCCVLTVSVRDSGYADVGFGDRPQPAVVAIGRTAENKVWRRRVESQVIASSGQTTIQAWLAAALVTTEVVATEAKFPEWVDAKPVEPVRYSQMSEYPNDKPSLAVSYWFDHQEQRRLTRLEAVTAGLERDPYKAKREKLKYGPDPITELSDWDDTAASAIDLAVPRIKDLTPPTLSILGPDLSGEDL